MTDNTKTFTLDEKEYSFKDISEKAAYIVNIVADLQSETIKLQVNLDKNNVSIQAFTNLLREELKEV